MAVVTTTPVAVGIAAAAALSPGSLPFAAAGTATVVISNLGPTNPVFLGGPGVTAATGIQLAAGASLVLPGATCNGLYAIATTAPVTVVLGVF